MIISRPSLMVLAAVCCFCAGPLLAQTDYTTKTLSFENITGSNVVQTVPESTAGGGGSGHEKEIDFGDWDNDGDTDAVMAVARSDFGERRNKLYRNDDGVMQEVSGSPTISGFTSADVARSAFLRDYDGDGWLDIVIICDSNSGTGSNESPGKTKFYRNTGGMNPTFVNESARLDNQSGAACNGTSEDFDNNGTYDLYHCNYPNSSQDSLGLNGIGGDDEGIFTEVTSTNMAPATGYGVHSEAADLNDDGTLDMLVTNRTNSTNYIYYNDLMGAGTGPGDFRYGSGGVGGRRTVQELQSGTHENVMVPADFDNDGDMDFYFSNSGRFGNLSDAIYVNTGNDSSGAAIFNTYAEISPVLNGLASYKVCPTDLDDDGKIDVVVMSEFRQPYIFRNTSANGQISFLDWTPNMFNGTHEGWQANCADITDNGRPDVFIGAMNNDFLFENQLAELSDLDSLAGGVVPAFHNDEPIAVSGSIAGQDTKTLIVLGSDVPAGAEVSMLVRSSADLSLSVSLSGTEIASSSRPGEDVEEAVHFEKPSSGNLVVEVTNEGVRLGDVNDDGNVDLLDVQPFVDEIAGGGSNPAADVNQDGTVDLLDVGFFVAAIQNGGVFDDFVIEFLSRN